MEALPQLSFFLRGGRTFLQLWRMGRRVLESYLSPFPFCQSQLRLTAQSFLLPPACSLPADLPLRQRSGGRTKEKAEIKVVLGGAEVQYLYLSSYSKGARGCPSILSNLPGPQRPIHPLLPDRQEEGSRSQTVGEAPGKS